MKLSIDELKSFAHGAVRFEENNGNLRLYRFTEEQENWYKKTGNEAFYLKSLTSAGIKLVFQTNSTSLSLKVNILNATTRSYFSYDVYVNDRMIGNIDNFSNVDLLTDYTKGKYPIGKFSKDFYLGDDIKKITIYLPWSVVSEIEEISLDDGAFTEAAAVENKLLIFGDSITQGYDSMRPSNHYTVKLAEFLHADCFNKAIGGEVFVPELAMTEEAFVPDYIIVAYGSNDWSTKNIDDFQFNCKQFYEILSKKYPASDIFAITPIWRSDCMDKKPMGDFMTVANFINEVSLKLSNVHCISGLGLVPHQKNMYADRSLHPTDEGFGYYANTLCEHIKEIVSG